MYQLLAVEMCLLYLYHFVDQVYYQLLTLLDGQMVTPGKFTCGLRLISQYLFKLAEL